MTIIFTRYVPGRPFYAAYHIPRNHARALCGATLDPQWAPVHVEVLPACGGCPDCATVAAREPRRIERHADLLPGVCEACGIDRAVHPRCGACGLLLGVRHWAGVECRYCARERRCG